jgi:hypothetical protein
MDVEVWLEFVIRHRRWAAPAIWAVMVSVFTAGAISAGFDQAALPWICGVVAVLVAGFIAGVADVLRGRGVGWLGIAGWLVVPILHLWATATTDSWTAAFVADLIAILFAEGCAGVAIAGVFFPPRPGSQWLAPTGEQEDRGKQPPVRTLDETARMRLSTGAAVGMLGLALLVVALVVASCGGDGPTAGGSTTSTATSSPAEPQSTTASTSSSTTSTSSTTAVTTSSAPRHLADLLIAHDDGIALLVDGAESELIGGVPVELAFPDLRGGVVYQEVVTGSWHWDWDAAAGLPAPVVDEGDGPVPIMWIPGPGEPPEVLIAAAGTRPTLSQIVELDGHPTLVYRDTVFVIDEPAECEPGQFECLWPVLTDHLFLLDLVTTEVRDLGAISSFESSAVGVRFADGVIAVRTVAYGEEDGCGALYPRATLDPPSHEWIGEGGVLWRTCGFGPTVGCEGEGCWGNLSLAVAPDGSTVAYAEYRTLSQPPELVVIDTETRRELARMVIGDAGMVPTWIDWDGSTAAVGRRNETALGTDEERTAAPVLVELDGAVTELPRGWRVAFWRSES